MSNNKDMLELVSPEALTASQEWRRYWPLVAAAAIGFSFHSLLSVFAGLYMGPMSEELGWSLTQLTAGMSVSAIISMIVSPFFGVLIDRWGTRRLAIPGLVLKALVVAAFGLMSSSLLHWVAMWAVYAFVALAVKSTIWTSAISGLFTKGRGLALGVVLSGNALTQILVPPLGNWLITEFGWRIAFVWLGLGWGSVAFILCLLFLYDAHDHLRRARVTSPEHEHKKLELPGLTITQARRDPALWRIAISTLLTMLFTIALMVHQFPILLEAGVPRTQAALLMSLGGVAAIFGKIITGLLLDRFRPNWVGALTLIGGGLAFALLLEPLRTQTLIVAAIVINGYTSGTKLQICGYLTSRYAGMRNFGAIFGFMASLIAVASGLGPVLGGLCYDLYGDYTFFLIIGLVGSVLSGVIIFGLGNYPQWGSDETEKLVAGAPLAS